MKKLFILLILIAILFSGCNDVFVTAIPTNAKGNMEFEKIDQTSPSFNLYLSEKISDINLTQNLTVGQATFNITSSIAPVVGNYVCLKDKNTNAFTQEEVKSVTSLGGNLYEVTLHAGVETGFSIDDGCSLRNINMAVDGSITPRVFSISPLGLNESVKWQVVRMICGGLGDGVDPGNDKPDGTSLLTVAPSDDGFYVRARNNERTKNLFHVKTNSEIKNNMYDLQILDANRGGEYEVSFRITWNGDDKHGTTQELSANISDNNYHYIDLVVETDLSDMSSFNCKIQGHETGDYIGLLN